MYRLIPLRRFFFISKLIINKYRRQKYKTYSKLIMFGLTTLFVIIQKIFAEQALPLYVSDCWLKVDNETIEIIVWNEEP